MNRDPAEEYGGFNLYSFVENNPSDGIDFLGFWKVYNLLQSNPNYRFELSISALTRKFNLPRVPIVHDTLKAYGIILEAKQIKKNNQKCVEVSINGFGNAGALKQALKAGLKKIPGMKRIADKLEADVLAIGAIKIIDCECYKKEDVSLGGEAKIQAQAGYGPFFGKKPSKTRDYRTGNGGRVGKFDLGGVRGPFVGAFAEFGFSPVLSDEGFDLEIGGGATGFGGFRGDSVDFRLGGEISGKGVVGVIPKFQYKAGEFNVSFL